MALSSMRRNDLLSQRTLSVLRQRHTSRESKVPMEPEVSSRFNLKIICFKISVDLNCHKRTNEGTYG